MINNESKQETYEIFPIGYVRREQERTYLEILGPYIPAVKQLRQFSHAQVLFWFNRFQDMQFREIVETTPPYDAPTMGIFASRSPIRPNPIGLATVKILNADENTGIIEIGKIDAFDDTPVVDIKAYFPCCDRVKEVKVAEWAADWGEWMPEEGNDLE